MLTLNANRWAALLLLTACLCLFARAHAERYTIPWFEPPSAGGDPQGVLRIVNASGDAGTVTIHTIDETGVRTGTAVVALNGYAAVDISATELQTGDAAKGLSSGVGNLSGSVRMAIESDMPIVPLALARAADGTVSALHDTVLPAAAPGSAGYRYDVPIFHPASNATQPSRLRLINPADAPVEVTIEARDDTGAAASGGTVQLTLPPGAARTLTSLQLEAGDAAAFTGRLGAGAGSWRLSVSADRPIEVLNMAVSTGGDWSNLSTTAAGGWAPRDGAGFEARFLERAIVSRDGLDRLELRVLAGNRFRAVGIEAGVETSAQGSYGYERTARDSGRMTVEYDSGEACEANFHFSSPISGWYASGCVDGEDLVQLWTGGYWLGLDAQAMPLDLGHGPDAQTFTAGTAIDAVTLPEANGGEGGLTYSLSPEVPGLSFDPETRELTGTPTEAGAWLMTYRVRDGSGDTDWRYFDIAVEAATGAGETTHGVGSMLTDLPGGSWTPDVTSGGTFSSSGGNVTVRLDEGGFIEEGEFRYTCRSSGGCAIENRSVTSGTIVRTAKGTAPSGGMTGGRIGNFDLHDDNSWPSGIVHANGRFHVLDVLGNKVYAYTDTGERDASADFDLDEDNSDALGIAHANGRFFVVDGFGKKAYAYTGTGGRDASADFDLHNDNVGPEGIAHANGRFHVVDSSEEKVFAYTDTGGRDASADFDLDEDNAWPRGIAHANGRFYVVDVFEEKAYAYTETGGRDASADFDLLDENTLPAGIAFANGLFYVVDNSGADSRVYEYGGTESGAGPSFPPGDGGGQSVTFGSGDTIADLPTGSWAPDAISGGSFRFSGGIAIIELDDGGYIEEGDYRFTCQSAGGCRIDNRRVTSGTVARTSGETAPGGGDTGSDDHGDDRASATAVGAGSDTQAVLTGGDVDYFSVEVSAAGTLEVYTSGDLDTLGRLEDAAGSPVDDDDDGGDDTNFRIAADVSSGTYYVRVSGFGSSTAGDYTLHVRFTESDSGATPPGGGGTAGGFDLHDDQEWPTGIAHANGRFHVLDSFHDKVYAYTDTGSREASADFDLHDTISRPEGIAHANGRFHVVDRTRRTVYAYTETGSREALADFDLHDDNSDAHGIAHANGRFYVVDDGFDEDNRVYAYTETGGRDASADFDLHQDNTWPRGIAYADGRLYVVDDLNKKVYAYTEAGARDASADFDLHENNSLPTGIAYANGRFYVVDFSTTYSMVFEYADPLSGSQPSFAEGSGPGDQTYAVGAAIATLTLPEGGGGDGPLTYSLSPAVPGLSFNATTRRLTGTPSTAGAYDMTYRVRDTDGDTDSLTFTITVTDPTQPDDYTPLAGLRVSAGRVQYGFFSAGGCIRLNNTTINGVTYTAHSSKWQRRDSANSAWEDVPGTEQQGGLCAHNPTAAGEYRLVGEVSIDGVRGRYSSENTIVVS
ncbi:MAG: putative Ig domain-containing protein [Rhodospirillaceae bacterium]|nr:putative Ig domain-containing protein [Rhodospirillaceae bacterium]